MKKRLAALTLTASTLAFVAPALAVDETFKTEHGAIRVTTFAEGLERPWGMAFLPEGRLLVTERTGAMRLISPEGEVGEEIKGVPEVDFGGQGGLLDVAAAPDFEETRRIYFTYSEAGEGGNSTAAAMATLSEDGASLDEVRKIFTQLPKYEGNKHFGSRIVFDGEGHVFIGLGERSDVPIREGSQRLDNHLGKVVRLNLDGSVPKDNPFVGQDGALPEIYSYGHRNIQGGALDPESGRVFFTEHGPRGGDEVNVIEAKANYGWPVVSYGVEYSGAPVGSGKQSGEGFKEPLHHWTPVTGASGLTFYTGDLFPEWKGDAFSGGLVTQDIARLTFEGDKLVNEERLLGEIGERIREVEQGPDGALYVMTDGPKGEIWKVVPAE